ncbi:MAG: AfsR/SARP family transcriptional regulator [Vulcanimicrobiaceae bacterium]
MPSRLQFRFLGPFAIGCDGAWHLGPPPKKGRELIQYLAVYPRRVATPEDMAAAFWPDFELDEVRHRIHLAASGARVFLRRVLNGLDALVCSNGGYSWNPAVSVESDIERFIDCSRHGTLEGYRNAVELYEGEFLAGESADWLQPMRVRLATARALALEALAEHALAAGDHARAISLGLELVEAEPGHETGTRLVMRCFAQLGQRTRALEQYARLERYLAEQIGVEPTEETWALAQQVTGVAGYAPASRAIGGTALKHRDLAALLDEQITA